MTKSLGISNPLGPKTSLGLGHYGSSLRFFQLLGSRSLGILKPALFQRQVSPVGLESLLSETPDPVEESPRSEQTKHLTNGSVSDIQARADTSAHNVASPIEERTSQQAIGEEDIPAFKGGSPSTFQGDAHQLDQAEVSLSSNSTLSETAKDFPTNNTPIQQSPSVTSNDDSLEEIAPQQHDVSSPNASIQSPRPETSSGTPAETQPSVSLPDLSDESQADLLASPDSALLPDLSAKTKLEQDYLEPFSSPLPDHESSQTSICSELHVPEVTTERLESLPPSKASKVTARGNSDAPKIQKGAISVGINADAPIPLQVENIPSGSEVEAVHLSANPAPDALPNASEIHGQKRVIPESSSAKKSSSESHLSGSQQLESETQKASSPKTASSPLTISTNAPASTSVNPVLPLVDGHLKHLMQTPSKESFGEEASPTYHPESSDNPQPIQSRLSNIDNLLARRVDTEGDMGQTPADGAKVAQEMGVRRDRSITTSDSSDDLTSTPQNSLANPPSPTPFPSTENELENRLTNDNQTNFPEAALEASSTKASSYQHSLETLGKYTIRHFSKPLRTPKLSEEINFPELHQVLKSIGILESLSSQASTEPLMPNPQGIAKQILSDESQQSVASSLPRVPELPDYLNSLERSFQAFSSPLPHHTAFNENAWPMIHQPGEQAMPSGNWQRLTEFVSSAKKATLPKSLPSQSLSQPILSSNQAFKRVVPEQIQTVEPSAIATPLNRHPFPDLHPLQPRLDPKIVKSSTTMVPTQPQAIAIPVSAEDRDLGSKNAADSIASPGAIAKLTTQVYQLVKQRLLIEQERQGRFHRRLG